MRFRFKYAFHFYFWVGAHRKSMSAGNLFHIKKNYWQIHVRPVSLEWAKYHQCKVNISYCKTLASSYYNLLEKRRSFLIQKKIRVVFLFLIKFKIIIVGIMNEKKFVWLQLYSLKSTVDIEKVSKAEVKFQCIFSFQFIHELPSDVHALCVCKKWSIFCFRLEKSSFIHSLFCELSRLVEGTVDFFHFNLEYCPKMFVIVEWKISKMLLTVWLKWCIQHPTKIWCICWQCSSHCNI